MSNFFNPEIYTVVYPNFRIFVCAFLGVLTILISGLFVIPLQAKQSIVRNGLRRLRVILLLYGISYMVSSGVGLYFFFKIATRLFYSHIIVTNNTQTLLLVFTSAIFFQSILAFVMYRLQFGPKSIDMHRREEKRELRHQKNYPHSNN